MDLRQPVEAAHLALDLGEFRAADQVRLVQQHHVGEGQLRIALVAVQVLQHVLGVDQGDDGVQAQLVLHLVVHEKGLRHRTGIGHAGGLDDDVVELVLAPHQAPEDADQVATHGAADAAVVHLEDLFVGLHHQLVVDADLAVFVLDHRDALAVLLAEDAVEQGGLARAEKTGEHGDRHARIAVRLRLGMGEMGGFLGTGCHGLFSRGCGCLNAPRPPGPARCSRRPRHPGSPPADGRRPRPATRRPARHRTVPWSVAPGSPPGGCGSGNRRGRG